MYNSNLLRDNDNRVSYSAIVRNSKMSSFQFQYGERRGRSANSLIKLVLLHYRLLIGPYLYDRPSIVIECVGVRTSRL